MEIKTKDELLEQISLAVEQIQKQFVQGGNVIKDCQETFFLCQCIDNILHHGLKEGLISWKIEPTIWPLLEKITCSKDIEEIKMLQLKTDKEKCNAWIKMAVNGNLLGSYIATIDQDHSLLSHHYYEYAFLHDPVMADTVKSILNYGIANFDFQISVSQSYLSNEPEITAKHEHSVGYDTFENATKENGYDSLRPETGLLTSQESWSKKKRKKKKQAVKTAVIEDQDDYGEFDEMVGKEKQNSDMPKHSFDENSKEILTKDENHIGSLEEKNSLGSTNETHSLNTVESSLVKTDQSGDEFVSDVRPNSAESLSNGHMTNPANNDEVIRTNDQSDGSEKADRERAVFVSNDLDQYLTLNNKHNSETSSKNDKELDSLGSLAEKASSRQVFSPNDFLLDQTELENTVSDNRKEKTTDQDENQSSFDTKKGLTELDSTSTLTGDPNVTDIEQNSGFKMETSNSRNFEKGTPETFENNQGPSDTKEDSAENCEKEDSSKINEARLTPENSRKTEEQSHGNEEISESAKSKSHVSKIFPKSERRGTESNEEFSEILSSGNSYDYRVRKLENPELFSSSYGSSSALSDFTDDDRDLNFIPGIHRMSSKSFSSSFERKSTTDSSVSFDENGFPLFESSHYTDYSSSQPSSTDDGSSSRLTDLSNEWDMFEDLLNVEEEHFSQPDNFAGLTTGEELEMAIEHYKKMIKKKKDKSQRDDLVKKLIKLRLRLQQEREGPPVENPKCRKILSHEFSKTEGVSGTKYFCDQCGKNIWTMWQSLFTCNGCGYHSHRKCMEHIQRACPNKNLSSVSYILDICPDTGLDAQQYRCAECRKEIAFSRDDVSEARICDYTGQYFCDNCHWNDQISIPARVLRNWDFTQHKVCRKSKQLLELMKTRPIINIQEINPMLYRYVEELREVGKLRDDILIMKKYFLTCREALESKLLIQLQKRQHFVDSAHTYSFQDLVDLNNDVLVPEVSKIHALFLAHIKADCELCRARGFICEVCRDSSDIIFAFDPHAVKCTNCSAVFHKICFKPEDCPKCQRKKKVAELT